MVARIVEYGDESRVLADRLRKRATTCGIRPPECRSPPIVGPRARSSLRASGSRRSSSPHGERMQRADSARFARRSHKCSNVPDGETDRRVQQVCAWVSISIQWNDRVVVLFRRPADSSSIRSSNVAAAPYLPPVVESSSIRSSNAAAARCRQQVADSSSIRSSSAAAARFRRLHRVRGALRFRRLATLASTTCSSASEE